VLNVRYKRVWPSRGSFWWMYVHILQPLKERGRSSCSGNTFGAMEETRWCCQAKSLPSIVRPSGVATEDLVSASGRPVEPLQSRPLSWTMNVGGWHLPRLQSRWRVHLQRHI